jgi:putative transposase
MYEWRKMTEEERAETLRERRHRKLPWHRPPHWEYVGPTTFIVSAACFEHSPIIGFSSQRIADFEAELLEALQCLGVDIFAWCILPNHYHTLIRAEANKAVIQALGRVHGRTSFRWNTEENRRGRRVWFNAFDRPMKSERHYWATVNYIHHNPVKHGYVEKWTDWPFSSANRYLEEVGRQQALATWTEFPILDYGKGWDE